jgi:hypothetical protein
MSGCHIYSLLGRAAHTSNIYPSLHHKNSLAPRGLNGHGRYVHMEGIAIKAACTVACYYLALTNQVFVNINLHNMLSIMGNHRKG